MATSTLIDLSSLNQGATRLFCEPRLQLPDFGVYRFPSGTDVDGEVENLGGAVNIYGSAKLVYASRCDLCLEEYTASLTIAVDEQLPLQGASDPLGDSNVIHDGILDVGDLIRQLVNAELPFVSLCRTSCAGLCPSCGTNRNEGTCSCEATTKGDHG